MTEAELIEQLFTIRSLTYGLIQWWASVSFAVLIAAHLSVKQLNGPICTAIVAMYTLYSYFIVTELVENVSMTQAGHFELSRLASLATEPGLGRQIVSGEGLDGHVGLLLIFTYLMVIGYVSYSYFKQRKIRKQNPAR